MSKGVKRSLHCRICTSPVRGEIEYLIKIGASRVDIAKKYYEAFNIKQTSMYNKVLKHAKGNHPPMINMEKVTVMPTTQAPQDFQSYAKKLLAVGFSDDMLNANKVSHSNIIAAQRTLIEEEKVKGELSNQKMLLMKFFRGKVDGVIEGEVVDGTQQIEHTTGDTN